MTTQDTTYPHLTRAWRDAVALQLRARGASGTVIGDVLAVAEAHCADSGETADDAFGTPRQYAAAVPLPAAGASEGLPALVGSALPTLVGLAGMMLAFAATEAWVSDQATRISWGVAVATAVILAFAVALVQWLAVFAERRWILSLVVGAAAVGVTALMVVWDDPAFTLPTWLAIALSATLLAVGALWTARGPEPDPIADPLRGDPTPGATRFARVVGPALLPVATVIGVALIALISGSGRAGL